MEPKSPPWNEQQEQIDWLESRSDDVYDPADFVAEDYDDNWIDEG